MERHAIRSSAILSVGYDLAHQTIEIELSSLAVYAYKNVPPEVYGALLNAESPGRFWVEKLRGHYEYERVSAPPSRKGTPDSEIETKLRESLSHGTGKKKKPKANKSLSRDGAG